jgi:hypothetical protein
MSIMLRTGVDGCRMAVAILLSGVRDLCAAAGLSGGAWC